MQPWRRLAQVMRDRTPVPLRRLAVRAGLFLGKGLPEGPSGLSMESAFEVLRRRGFQPGFCVDIGAYQGEWTNAIKVAFPKTRVLMVEAQEGQREALEAVCGHHRGSVSLAIALLGPVAGERVSFFEMKTGSSVFPENSPYPRRTVEKQVVTLDALLEDNGISRVDLLKLDVQGYEVEVLKGGRRALQECQVVLTEASLLSVNQGSPRAAELINFIENADFRLFDICGQRRMRDGVLFQCDLVFVRRDSPLVPEGALTKENWG